MMLIACLGLRKSEALNIRIRKIVVLGKGVDNKNEDYVEVTGKGKKERPVPLGFLKGYLDIIYKRLRHAHKKNDNLLFPEIYSSQFENLFRKYFGDIAPSGMHSYRHNFTTRCINKGTGIVDVSAFLGHETARVAHNTYGMDSYESLIENKGKVYLTKTKLTHKELSSFLQLTKDQIVTIKHGITGEKRKNRHEKRTRDNTFCFDAKQIINKCVDDYAKRVSRVSMRLRESIWQEYYKKGRNRGRHIKKNR